MESFADSPRQGSDWSLALGTPHSLGPGCTQGPGKVVTDVTDVTCVVAVCRAGEATRPR
jgi:hypothetical protein